VNLSLFLAVSYPQSLSRAVTTFARFASTINPNLTASYLFFSQTANSTVVNATVLKLISFWERRQFFDNGKQKIENSATATECG